MRTDSGTTDDGFGDNTKSNTSEPLAAGVTSSDSSGELHCLIPCPSSMKPCSYSSYIAPVDASDDSQPLGSTSAAASKGTDEDRGLDEQVTSSKRPPSPNN